MAVFSVQNIKVSGIAASAPADIADNLDCGLLSLKERDLFVKTVGIRYRRIAPPEMTASDLCFAAAEKLISDINWDKNEIDILIFITQTPDYLIPNTASVLQQRLGLSKKTIAFDINLGCSGYVYGLSIAGSLLQNMPGGKALLLVGDVSTHTISQKDKSTVPLFSDAGSATALEYSQGAFMHFNLQTDGNEFDDILVPDGGFRNKVNENSFVETEYEQGITRTNLDMKLDGVKIFNFALREVAPNVRELLEHKNVNSETIDYLVMHQANKLMLESVRKKTGIAADKVPYSLFRFGNTSSASIPLTIVTELKDKVSEQPAKLLLSGFGVGLSWGSCYLETENLVCPEIIECK